MDESVKLPFERYLRERSLESFLELREAVAASPSYSPYSKDLGPADTLVDQEEFEEARSYLMSIKPNWIANPRIHIMLSFVQRSLGSQEEARYEHELANVLLQGILSTGDGSEARPYLVLRTVDEYDVLRQLGNRPQRQSLVEKGDERYDRRDCEDGSQIWFDVTTQFVSL